MNGKQNKSKLMKGMTCYLEHLRGPGFGILQMFFGPLMQKKINKYEYLVGNSRKGGREGGTYILVSTLGSLGYALGKNFFLQREYITYKVIG